MTDLSPGAVVRVVNPSAVVQIASPGLVQGLVLKEGAAGVAGRSITDFERTAGDGSPGTTDTYTVTFNDATTYTFEVYNGTNGPNGIGVPAGGTAGQVLVKSSATDYDTGWVDPPSSGGGLLATASLSGVSISTTSSSLVDVDPALTVTFTAPASGAVIVRLTGMGRISGSAGNLTWGIRSGTTTVASGYVALSLNGYAAASTAYLLTGLTPGASYAYKWAHSRSGTGTGYLESTGSAPMSVMEVVAA